MGCGAILLLFCKFQPSLGELSHDTRLSARTVTGISDIEHRELVRKGSDAVTGHQD